MMDDLRRRIETLSPQQRLLLAMRLPPPKAVSAAQPGAAKVAEKRLVAYVVPAGGGVLDEGELRAYLSGRLPGYMVPARLVTLEALPLTPNGKLDRGALPDPETARPTAAAGPAEPGSPTEVDLAALWAELFGFEPVGAQDDFFELGGHSLLAARLAARLQESYGVDVPVSAVFQLRTVAALARHLDTLRWAKGEAPGGTSAGAQAGEERDEIEL
jgi:acyl carrier protein